MTDESELGAGRTCFIISPIGNKYEPLGSAGRSRYEESLIMWEEVLLPATAQFGLDAVRSDKISEPGEIPNQIFEYLRDAHVVIADLSHGNANVMYELGLRHSRPGITLQIGEYGLLPFDVTTIRTTQFIRTAAGRIGARDELIESLRAALQSGATTLRSTQVFSENAPQAPMDVERDVARSFAPEDDGMAMDEPGIADILADGEAAVVELSEILTESTEVMGSLSNFSTSATEAISRSDAERGGFAGRLLVAKRLAADLEAPGKRLEELGEEFYKCVEKVNAMLAFIISRMREDEEERVSGQEFIASILGLVEVSTESAVGLAGYRESVRGMKKLAKDLAAPARVIEGSVTRFLEGISTISSWGAETEGLLDEQ